MNTLSDTDLFLMAIVMLFGALGSIGRICLGEKQLTSQYAIGSVIYGAVISVVVLGAVLYKIEKVSVISAAALGGFTGAFTDMIVAFTVDRFQAWKDSKAWTAEKRDRRNGASEPKRDGD